MCLALGAASLLQGPACSAQTAPLHAEQQQSAAEVVQGFESPDQAYVLGRGDEIFVEVVGRAELSGKQVVGPDGRITLPIAGDIPIAGMTRAAAAAAVQNILKKYYENTVVSVRVDRYTSNSVLVLGAVEHPGLLLFDGPPSLLEAVTRAGSGGPVRTSSLISPPTSLLSTGGLPATCIVYRGDSTMLTVDLRDLLKRGDLTANVRLRKDDIVYVPGDAPYISVLGSVTRPGLVGLDPNSTLAELIAAASGLTDKAGKYPKVIVVHPAHGTVPGSTQVVNFRDVLAAKPIESTLRSGDILYVPENGFNRTSDVFQKLSPLVSLVTIGALIQ